MAAPKYPPGCLFAVPLRDGGFAVGVVARANRDGVLLGYFFGPKLDQIPALEDVSSVKTHDAELVAMFGHLGLKKGTWPILGQLPRWERSDWPMPVFVRYEELTGRSLKVFYDDDDPNKLIREEQTTPGVSEQLPQDGLYGAGAIEILLTALLR